MGFKITIHFIWYCLRIGANPWMYAQIHARFFNVKKGIFSKYDIEQNIPEKWRLRSTRISSNTTLDDILDTHKFPLFGKPEWGQNAHGVVQIKDEKDLGKFLKQAKSNGVKYLVQDASKYVHEYEICFARDPDDLDSRQIYSVAQSLNDDGNQVSSINAETRYKEISHDFSPSEKQTITDHIKKMGDLWIGRVGLKADSTQDIIKGKFDVFEINIFVPLPLKLLAYNVDESQKKAFLKKWTYTLAKLTKTRPKQKYKEVFLRKAFLHYKLMLIHNKTYMNIKRIIYSFIEDKFLNGCSDYNSLEVRRASRSKKQAREMFAAHDIPHAKGMIFFNPYTAYKFAKQHGFPLVLKPNVSGFSRGSHFPIMTWKEFWTAMFFVKWWWPTTVIEQYLLGKNYRVVTTKNAVDIAMQRTPGYVIGDGKSTIAQLMKEENKIREQMKLTPTIHLLEKSYKIKKHLKQQGLSFDSVLEKGKKIFLYYRVSLAPGGVLETVDVNTITPKNKKLFIKILDLFHANVFGIDVIMEKGIDVDYDKQKTIFLEVNSRPYMKMHEFPRTGKAPDMKPLYDKLEELEVQGQGLY